MTRQDQQSAHPHDPDADRLSAAWNDIVEGFPPSNAGAGAELIATVRSLHVSAPDHRPKSEFRDNLREQLMDTAVPITMPGRAQKVRARDEFIGVRPIGASRSRVPQALRGTVVRWAAIAATIALLLTTLGAGYLGGIYPPGNGAEPTTNLAAPYFGTPEAAGTPVADPCADARPYIPCGGNSDVGGGLIYLENLPQEALAATKVQMQGWELGGSERIMFSGPNNPVAGAAVDVVVFGAYQATFSAPVVVRRQYPGGGGLYEYPDANAVVELSSGDSVTYQIGTKTEVKNPFGATTLKFKSVLFYDGDPSPENLMPAGHVQVRIDGDGTLPMALGKYTTPEVQVMIAYVSLIEGYPFPPKSKHTAYVLGPVASTLALGGPNEGFVVWVSTDASRG